MTVPLKRVMLQFSVDLSSPPSLNYPEIPDSCLLRQFAVTIYFLNMLINCANVNIVKRRHHLLRQPAILILLRISKLSSLPPVEAAKVRYSAAELRNANSFFLRFLSISLCFSPIHVSRHSKVFYMSEYARRFLCQ